MYVGVLLASTIYILFSLTSGRMSSSPNSKPNSWQNDRILTPWVKALVAPGAIVHTDGWDGYGGLPDAGYDHTSQLQRRRQTDEQKLLPRAHRASSNLKTWLQGTHRGVSPRHLQVYVDEFVFRHNRRRNPMAAFQTLLGLGAIHGPTTYAEITAHRAAA